MVAPSDAWMEGREKGIIRAIHVLEQYLKRHETPTEQLTEMSLDDLTRLADMLQAEAMKLRQ